MKKNLKTLIIFSSSCLILSIAACNKDDNNSPQPRYRLIKKTHGNNINEYAYDNQGKLISNNDITYEYNNQNLLSKFKSENSSAEFKYNPDGSIRELINTYGSRTEKFVYNSIVQNNIDVIYQIEGYYLEAGDFKKGFTLKNTHNSKLQPVQFTYETNNNNDFLRGVFEYDSKDNIKEAKLFRKRDNGTEYIYAETSYTYNDQVSSIFIDPEFILTKYVYSIYISIFYGSNYFSPNFPTQFKVRSYDQGEFQKETVYEVYGEFNDVGYPVKRIVTGSSAEFYEYEKY